MKEQLTDLLALLASAVQLGNRAEQDELNAEIRLLKAQIASRK